jgi:hypothetical protein
MSVCTRRLVIALTMPCCPTPTSSQAIASKRLPCSTCSSARPPACQLVRPSVNASVSPSLLLSSAAYAALSDLQGSLGTSVSSSVLPKSMALGGHRKQCLGRHARGHRLSLQRRRSLSPTRMRPAMDRLFLAGLPGPENSAPYPISRLAAFV